MKIFLGFLLAFGIGAICRLAGIPSPAPNAILGSLLVVAMSVGYVTADHYIHRSRKTISLGSTHAAPPVSNADVTTHTYQQNTKHDVLQECPSVSTGARLEAN